MIEQSIQLSTIVAKEIENHELKKAEFVRLLKQYQGDIPELRAKVYQKKMRNPKRDPESIFLDEFSRVVDLKSSYFGRIFVDSEETIPEFEAYKRRSQFSYLHTKLASAAALFGVSYKLLFNDEDGNVSAMKLETPEVIYIENRARKKPDLAIRYYDVYDETEKKNLIFAEVYDDMYVHFMKSEGDVFVYNPHVETPIVRHMFKEVPIIRYLNNEYGISNTSRVEDLVFAKSFVWSDYTTELQTYANGYFKLIGADWTEQDEKTLNATGIWLLPEGADVDWLTKEVLDTATLNYMKKNDEMISRYSRTVDLDNLGSQYRNLTEVKLRMLPMESDCDLTQHEFESAYAREFELVVDFLNRRYLTAYSPTALTLKFKRNIPTNLLEEVQTIGQGRGHVSLKTLYKNVSFIDDVEKEIEQLEEEQTSMLFPEEGQGTIDDDGTEIDSQPTDESEAG